MVLRSTCQSKSYLVQEEAHHTSAICYCEPKEEEGAPKNDRNGTLGMVKPSYYLPLPRLILLAPSFKHIYKFLLLSTKTNVQANGKGKEHPRTIGMGGTGKTQYQISFDARRQGTELMLSSMFLFPVLFDPLFLPLPCSPSIGKFQENSEVRS
ncbi:hypothetical protein SETIT_7G102600v2 [Setaria italica]|uniref:Uncharacterized protein n=1 Tax=Setaria italica TaxID=4555 RepID=A0A368RU94_SETIT|nr:hypothetical protein SETIT_7G102600v2 [Setaria italica]